MKRYYILLFFVVVFLQGFRSDHPGIKAGIFITEQDYIYGKINPFIHDSAVMCRVNPHHIFKQRYIDVQSGNRTFRFLKDSVYGYRDSKGNVFRFYGAVHSEYLIKEYKSVVVYTTEELVSGGKKPVYETRFFFSKTPASDILPLTVLNLKRVFPADFMLHHFLDLYADDASLSVYNDSVKCYNANLFLAGYNQTN